MEQAVVVLRKQGVSVAAKKATRVTSEGSVASYIHAGGKIGVLVEVNCESDFVARTEDFKELVHDIAMHIAASDPKFVRKEDVTPEAFEREKDIYRAQADASGKPPKIAEKMVAGKMEKFYEEVCLLEQPFIKDQTDLHRPADRHARSASWARTSRSAASPASRWAMSGETVADHQAHRTQSRVIEDAGRPVQASLGRGFIV